LKKVRTVTKKIFDKEQKEKQLGTARAHRAKNAVRYGESVA
jgi:hypothetical protein